MHKQYDNHASQFAIAVFLLIAASARSSWAQVAEPVDAPHDANPPSDEGQSAEAAGNATEPSLENRAPKAPDKQVPRSPHPRVPDRRNDHPGGSGPERAYGGLFSSSDWLGWDGNAQMDVGYAKYTFGSATNPPEGFYDFRGRFVFGPVLHHDFGSQYFLRATAQAVLWVREEYNKYQVNVDDVYFQVGKSNSFDFQLGRFMMWRVYQRGRGFDLYTLDDTGALTKSPFESGLFGVDMYEVNALYLRETPGHGALHYYPTEWLGFELGGVYGKELLNNTYGGRFAADAHFKFLEISAGAEYRTARPAQEQRAQLPSGETIVCGDCGKRSTYGAGGGAALKLGFVELGGSYARKSVTSYTLATGAPDTPGSGTTSSVGGFVEVDPGKLLLDRSLVLGFGFHRTSFAPDNGDFQEHDQSAAYVIYPLGFNDASIKMVLAKADLHTEEDTGGGLGTIDQDNDMLAGRVRFSYSF